MVHDLNPKNLHINELIFCKVQRKRTIFGVFWHYPQNDIFPQKIRLCQFFSLRHPNLMKRLRKILWAILEKTCLHTEILTY